MIYFSIKDLENFSGIKAHTIRTWEQRFTFLHPKRSEGLRRTYDCDELKLILHISFLNRNGYKVSHIAKMNADEMNSLVSSMCDLNHLQEKAVNDLLYHMAVMDVESFIQVLQNCEMSWGIDVVISEIIFPFFAKTVLLHQKEQKNYESHLLLVEQSLKQKIIAGIEKTLTVKTEKTALFFLCKKKSEPELLYLQYELKMAGFTVIYISSPVELSQLCAIAFAIKPLYIITSSGGKNPQVDSKDLVAYLNKHLPQTIFINLKNKEVLPFETRLQTSKEVLSNEVPVRLSQQKEGSFFTEVKM